MRGTVHVHTVVMPQMGESIAEGTIVRWIKKVGDNVDRDEPLFEISTDKVDAEIPSPAAGVLLEITVKEGETVPVNSVVATIGAAGEPAAARAAATRSDTAAPTRQIAGTPPPSSPSPPAPATRGAGVGPPPRRGAAPPSHDPADDAPTQRSSPLVRKIAQGTRRRHRRRSGLGRRRPRDEERHPRVPSRRARPPAPHRPTRRPPEPRTGGRPRDPGVRARRASVRRSSRCR